MFNRMQLRRTLVLVLFLSVSLGPKSCFSQSATIAPAVPDEDAKPTKSKSNEVQPAAKTTGLQFSDFFLSNAEDFANKKNLNGVLGSLRSALEYHKTEGWTPDKTHRIALKYADALYDNQEYEVCRHVLDSILKSFPDDLEASILRVSVATAHRRSTSSHQLTSQWSQVAKVHNDASIVLVGIKWRTKSGPDAVTS
jgi:hypothetical protein